MNHHSQGDASARRERPYVRGVSLRRPNVSFCLTDGSPGSGPKVRKHPYVEVFVVWEGDVTFTAGDDGVEATSGQIVDVPAGVARKLVSPGTGRAPHIDIHTSLRMTTE